ncbi:hypothetical protein Acid345_0469 [Candidatus Koribacter versatilis Ellin345]|uniref:Outer membrane lipoprotein-sorting protein n=1 Tax=Koribacter versatilis (strain Ellin345) TaxID=204669 RepID=Q1IUH6_KORVE|nr:hypothetical protein [Candidatus Koribacter versatilis]ABF39474.1 hypothetical protein Acid345_0469 [Candidatus Koribacter versatilis Ellin345]
MKRAAFWLALAGLALWASQRCAAQSDAPLDLLLDQAAKNVSGFLDKISDVRCTETVRQVKLDKNGKTEYAEDGVYDYFVLLQGSNDELLLDESRIPKREARDRKNTPMLISNGFSMLYLIFHPYYRNSFQFQLEADGLIDGHLYHRVRFTHISGNRTPVAVSVRGREYPLDLTGEAWFDSEAGMIVRLEATLNRDMQDIGLRTLHAQIDFARVSLSGWSQSYTFPTVATIEVESLRQHWRNVHRFIDYKRFMVDTQQAVAESELTKHE